MSETSKVCGYVRISKDDPASLSVESQTERIRKYCEFRGLNLIDVLIDRNISGGKALNDRPAGAALIGFILGGDIAGVVAVKHDRLWRDVVDGLLTVRDWRQRGIALHLVDLGGQTIDTGTAFGWLMFTQLLAFSEAERRIIGERTTQALGHKKANGEKTGGEVPFGYVCYTDGEMRDGVLVKKIREWPPEQDVIAKMREKRDTDKWSYQVIAAWLTSQAIANKAGGTVWHARTVQRILERMA